MTRYDPVAAAAFDDGYGEREWTAHALRVVVQLACEHGVEGNDRVVRDGIVPPEPSRGHLTTRLFCGSELQTLLARHPCRLLAASASELSPAALEPELREGLLRWELELAAGPGALNAGSHIIAVLDRT